MVVWNRTTGKRHVRRMICYAAQGALLLGLNANAGEHQHHGAEPVARHCSPGSEQVSVDCGATPTLAFDHAGNLWAAFEQGGHVYVASRRDKGEAFSVPVQVNDQVEDIEINGENRPKIAFGPGGELYLSWTRKVTGGYNGEIRFSRSLDRGSHFEPVKTINDDGLVTGHRFETLFVDTRGDVYLAWIDKRDLAALGEEERKLAGASVYYAVSTDSGASFAANRKVAASSCECCRIAVTQTPDGNMALLFRAIFDQHIRDHGFAIVGVEGVVKPTVRSTRDDWRIDACPHHGPAILGAGDGSYHLAWFTGGEQSAGIFYGRFNAVDGSLGQVTAVSHAASAGHPSLGRTGDTLALAWKEFDGEHTRVYLQASRDEGASWSDRAPVASTGSASDHPFLVSGNGGLVLSWQTADEGLQIIDLADRAAGGGP